MPSISIYEVFKRIVKQRSEGDALQAVALMRQGRVVDLSSTLALSAAHLSIEHSLPMADSIMLATAYAYEAALWTQDADFEGIPGVHYVAKNSGGTAG